MTNYNERLDDPVLFNGKDIRTVYPISTFSGTTQDELVEFIKQYGVEQRLDEIKLTKDNSEESYLGEDWWADESIKDNSAHEVPLSYFENRIAELKAQQEEV